MFSEVEFDLIPNNHKEQDGVEHEHKDDPPECYHIMQRYEIRHKESAHDGDEEDEVSAPTQDLSIAYSENHQLNQARCEDDDQ
jgi:hypothetical protein